MSGAPKHDRPADRTSDLSGESTRAVRVREFGKPVSFEEIPITLPMAGEVMIQVSAAGLNFPDLLVADGTYQALPELPFTLGMESAGVVIRVGPGVSEFSVGDRVLALLPYGAFADHIVVPTQRLYPVPEEMPLEEAAGFGLAFATAHFALLRRGGLQSRETVLITGVSGGVGAAAAFIAKAAGARVLGATRDVGRAASVVGDTVDAFVSSDPARLRDEVMDATDSRGADIVIDVVGGEVLAQSLRCAAWEGRVVVVGFASGTQPDIKPGHLLVKNITVSGLQVTDYIEREPETVRKALYEVGQDYADGRLRVPINAHFPMSEATEALSALQRGQILGKGILLNQDAQTS